MTPPNPGPYYPAGAQNIDIVAYYPATAGTSFSVATDQTADADYKASDLMFASVSNQAKQSEAVNLAFSHKMTKLNVNITAGQGVNSITSVSVLNVKPTVSFDQATGAVGAASGETVSIAMSNNGAAIIPAQTISGGLLSIVTDKGTAIYSVASKEFAAGQLYTLNITVNLRAVGTTTEITGWTSEGTVNVTPGDWTVTVNGSYTYNGSAIVPAAGNITVHSTSAGADIDPSNYNVYTDNNINAGEASLIVYGTGTYAGEFAYCTYTIGKADASISYATTNVEKVAWDVDFTNTLTKTGDGTVAYSSSDTDVAMVNASTGAVTAVGEGTATITATVTDGTNYTYATTSASYTLTVEAGTLSNLKTKLKNGVSGLGFIIGHEVYDNGTIAPKGSGRGTVVGYVANTWSSSAADISFPDSRILVIASEDAATGINWATTQAATGMNDNSARNGYSNTQQLVTNNAPAYLAANAAWTYQSKNGAAIVTGSSGWFLPSLIQIRDIYNGVGGGSRSTLQNKTGMTSGKYYWTSTEQTEDTYYMANALSSPGTNGLNKTTMKANVRACFVF